MPTTLPRYTVTATPDIATALDVAALAWPGETPGTLLRRLVLAGAEAAKRQAEARAALVDQWAGFLPGVFPPGAAQALKDEWPE
jgi:hypothetical protein